MSRGQSDSSPQRQLKLYPHCRLLYTRSGSCRPLHEYAANERGATTGRSRQAHANGADDLAVQGKQYYTYVYSSSSIIVVVVVVVVEVVAVATVAVVWSSIVVVVVVVEVAAAVVVVAVVVLIAAAVVVVVVVVIIIVV
ncbi:hypothetical protein ElyMa_006684500 [Elysia marginata]|uniref:Uncharacterized protein n=1 Tax=Elysia marginata TaxID=1093978 RepID=A0AAV4IR96_9GAST|nr:hypothetical protein ElyMa_006684500 [Elysia marginata]